MLPLILYGEDMEARVEETLSGHVTEEEGDM